MDIEVAFPGLSMRPPYYSERPVNIGDKVEIVGGSRDGQVGLVDAITWTGARIRFAGEARKIESPIEVERQPYRLEVEAQRPAGAYRISAPFYARKLPDGYPRQFGTRSRVWISPEVVSVIGEYNNAVRSVERCDYAALDRFIGRVIVDREDNRYLLVTDHTETNFFLHGDQQRRHGHYSDWEDLEDMLGDA